MAIKKNINNNLKIPNLFLFFAIFSSAIVLIITGIHTYKVMQDVLENSERSQIIRGHIENIRLFDEVLTSSALLAASTGNVQWEKRYRIFEPKLDSAINKLSRMDPLHQTLKITDNANIRLVAMENSVFELVRERKLNEAVSIMTGSEYARQKAIYSEGLSTFIKLYELETARQQTQLHNAANRHKWFFGLVILFLAIVWLPIEHFLRKSRAQILKQNQELEIQIQAREESERALQESKKQIEKTHGQLQESIKASGVGLWDRNLQTHEVYHSPEWKKQIGYEDDELQSSLETYMSHLHPDDAKCVVESTKEFISGKRDIFESEYRFRHKDGSYRWILAKASIQYDKSGKPLRLLGSHLDITERKKAEEKTNMLAHAVKNSADCISITDKDYKFIFVNDSFRKTYGFKEDEIIGQPISIIHSENNLPEVSNDLFSSIEEKKIWTGEVLNKRKDGNDFPVQLSLAPLLNDKGELLAFVGVSRDITENKRAEESLHASKQLIERIINAIPVRIFWKDKDLIYLGCNTIFARDAGFSDPMDIIGKDDFMMGWLDQAELYRSGDRQVIESGDPILLNEEPQTTPEGNTIILLTNKMPLRNSMGEIYGILGTSMNVTERIAAVQEIKLKNEELQKLNAEKDKFFSIISHDLRSPFSGLLGLTQIMAEELPDLTKAEIQSIAVRMRNSATNLFSLLENLLLWARMQQGLVPFNPEVIQIHKIALESIVMMVEPANIKGIEIVNDIPVDLNVFADSNTLQNVIRNLVSNAVKFTPKGGKVNLSAKVIAGNSIEVTITDTGIGISNAMIENLFRLDVQTNRKGTEGESSSGLGLLLCKEFIEKHGGKIWVESEEGKGSAFHFVIPSNQY
jgi:PAS domain S-box-containing protein